MNCSYGRPHVCLQGGWLAIAEVHFPTREECAAAASEKVEKGEPPMDALRSLHTLEQLREAHQEMESELQTLMRRRHPTPMELQRTQVLKKEKLLMKDKMRLLMHRVRVDT